MSFPDLVSAAEDGRALAELNRRLEALPAEERVTWALATLPQSRALSSSFGAQSAASLHLVTRQTPDIPVILVDTGYLFPETYRFADELAQRLQLNLKVYRPSISRAWMEARHGRLWENGVEGLDQYNALRKVEPMRRALDELAVRTWFAGLRRAQARTRSDAQVLELRNGRWKFQPLVDWTDRDIYLYLQRFDLPYHPLWDEGYISIGDTHTTARWEPGMQEEDTRFFGLKRECGIHVDL
ncbi:phosphoadenylyl-sulfate reductase [Tahibacter caeni]|uniref:phosphoadenylyl-sulfate reductase n=1 Tax=Tahibacter caeni TaxID=1453545 RepID=UPI002148AC8C|nr:phosphoadenylyl-sulfate reductase [Tahibacter caeni]